MKIEKKKRKKLLSNIPTNLYFWKFTLKNPLEIKLFINKGNKNQLNSMIRVLNYVKKYDKKFFEEIDGIKILEKLKEIKND